MSNDNHREHRGFRILSWNIQQGGGGRLPAQVAAIAERAPDIVALQEVFHTTAPLYCNALRAVGLNVCVDSFSLAPSLDFLVGARRYGQLLAARWPLRPLPPSEFRVPWPERVLSAITESPWGEIELHTTHVPPGASNGWIKVETLEGIYERLARPSPLPRILCGDFNAPQEERTDGTVITWGQDIQRDGSVELWERWQGDSGARWDRAERTILTGLAGHDLVDVFRLLHGYERQEYSWFWRGRGRIIGRRFDHLFASQALNPIACRYVHRLRELGFSDHAPIEVEFHPGSAEETMREMRPRPVIGTD